MRGTIKVLTDATWSFTADDGWMVASYIALSTLTSLFPLLIFMTALAGFFGSQELSNQAAHLLFEAWPAAVAAPLAREVHNVLTEPRGGLLTFGAIFALYFASGAIEALRTGLNRAYHFAEKRPWWLLRLQSIAFSLAAAAALLILAFAIAVWLRIWTRLVELAPGLSHFHGLLIGVLALGVPVLLAHKVLPAERLPWLDILPGVLATLFCSMAFGWGFGVYLVAFPLNYVSTYAGLASVMVAIVFLYSIAAIFVFGGELNGAILRARGKAKAG